MKVFLHPHCQKIDKSNGVGQVVHAQWKYLPGFGIEFTNDPNEADIIACHIAPPPGLPRLDVLHLHGLYWTGDKGSGVYIQDHHTVNRAIVEAVRRARAVTIPSEWAAMPFKHDMRFSPEVIPNGVDLELWKTPRGQSVENRGFVLWDKNRKDDVCDPTPAYELAKRGVPVVSTFNPDNLPDLATLQVTGRVPFAEMLNMKQQAEFYLATTKEVFSLSVLEALATGVPVLGYNWGGTAEAIRHKVEGYLVEPGDIDGLAEGYKWLKANRKKVSANCKKRAKLYEWRGIIKQYADLYQATYEKRLACQHKVAVIIPNHNYAKYLLSAITSCEAQVKRPDRIIVVDDASTDDSLEQLNQYLKPGYEVIALKENKGVANARNVGIQAASDCDYIICLDADDMLHPNYIESILPAFKTDPSLGVAWTKLAHIDEAGNPTGMIWDFNYEWEWQASPDPETGATRNGIPAGAMFRRTMWERAGGYKQVYHPAEDAEFWTRGLSLGFTAQRVTDEALFYYRTHEGSASRTKQAPPIYMWHPWAVDKQFPFAAPAKTMPLVRSYSEPEISVVIPVGPGHTKLLPAALDSLLGQTFRNWEVIVVDDTGGEDLHPALKPYPFVKHAFTGGREGAGFARNHGLKFAKAPLVLWLDADDYLVPTALEKMLAEFKKQANCGYVYSDWIRLEADGKATIHETPEYSQEAWLHKGQHAVTVLMRTDDAKRIGGFDTTLIGWEDWDFFIKCAKFGVCGHRVAEPLMVYRMATGTRREDSFANRDALLGEIRKRYEGVELMACGCQGAGKQISSPVVNQQANQTEGLVKMAFLGDQAGGVTYKNPATGNSYVGGNNLMERHIFAKPEDVEWLKRTGMWQLVGELAGVR